MRRRNQYLSRAFVLVCLTFMVRAGQDEETPVFRAQSEVVLVDLVVSDKKGNVVRDLKPEEIEIFEDGKRQDIVFFDLRKRAGSKEELTAEGPAGRSSISDLSFDRRGLPTSPVYQGFFVFLFDMQSMDFHGLQRAKDSIRTFFRSQLAPTDQVMVATIEPSFRVHLPFTSDASQMESALETLNFRPHESTSISRFVESVEERFALLEGLALNIFDPGDGDGGGAVRLRLDPELEGTISLAASIARQMLVSLELRVDFTCAAIGALSRHLRSLPGRKHLLYLSNGYPLNAKRTLSRIIKERAMAIAPGQIPLIHAAVNNYMLGSGRPGDLHRRLSGAVNQANRSHVSIYSIDPRGLMAPSTGSASIRGAGSSLNAIYSTEDITAPHEFLSSLSLQTGGLWFADDNDLSRPIRKAYLDGQEYYLIGYVPNSERRVGRFHKIKVKLKRKRVRLRHRKGYTEEDPSQAVTIDLANAFKFPDLFRDFPIKTQVSTEAGKLKVLARIPTEAVTFRSEGDQRRCVIEMFGAIFDGSGKWVGDTFFFAERIDLDFNSQQDLDKFLTYTHFSPVAEKPAPEGNYDLVVVLRQKLSGKIATSTHRLGLEGPPALVSEE